ncbi:MAG: shikimate kinase [Gemmatimonadales bacterium]|nr:shikimate kinase [Gemmatimonadales bacterium]
MTAPGAVARRPVVLVGLPGAGKSTVGRLAAEALRTEYRDIDRMVEQKMSMPIARIFAAHGEPKFRQLEREFASQALAGPPAVIAPGAGWIAQPGALEEARAAGAFLVYLRCLEETATKRAALSAVDARPMLSGVMVNPFTRMKELFREREPFYLKADATVSTELQSADRAADEVARIARAQAGW